MNIRLFFAILAIAVATQANADNLGNTPEQTSETTETKTELVNLSKMKSLHLDMNTYSTSPKVDFDFFKVKTNHGVKAYKFMDDMTFVGIQCKGRTRR